MPDPKPHVDGLFVLETYEGDAYLGQLLFERDFITVRTGYVGRPAVIPVGEVAQIVPAGEHPDVVVARAS
ncbi:MAG: hypothetical protein LC779_16390 [Actinobacteria bacterium]|nr:hypothetical protein [Actinomycetota bacterium]